jgi:hypothetical protein
MTSKLDLRGVDVFTLERLSYYGVTRSKVRRADDIGPIYIMIYSKYKQL